MYVCATPVSGSIALEEQNHDNGAQDVLDKEWLSTLGAPAYWSILYYELTVSHVTNGSQGHLWRRVPSVMGMAASKKLLSSLLSDYLAISYQRFVFLDAVIVSQYL